MCCRSEHAKVRSVKSASFPAPRSPELTPPPPQAASQASSLPDANTDLISERNTQGGGQMSKVKDMHVHRKQPSVSRQDFSNILSGIVFEFRALILCDLLWNLKGGIGNCIVPNDSQILQDLSISSCLFSVYTTRLTQRQSVYLQQNPEVRKKDRVERQEGSLEIPSLLCKEMGYWATLQTMFL